VKKGIGEEKRKEKWGGGKREKGKEKVPISGANPWSESIREGKRAFVTCCGKENKHWGR